jgi:hypothetical protein
MEAQARQRRSSGILQHQPARETDPRIRRPIDGDRVEPNIAGNDIERGPSLILGDRPDHLGARRHGRKGGHGNAHDQSNERENEEGRPAAAKTSGNG